MFVISDLTRAALNQTSTNNIRDIYDIVLGITGSESLAERAAHVASDMRFDDQHYFGNKTALFKIECRKE